MKAELDLLKKLAESSVTRYSEKFIYSLNNGVADLEDLIKGGYIRVEPVVSKGQEEKWYKITLKGWDFLNQLKERNKRRQKENWQIGLTIAVLILTLAGLLVSILK